MTQQEYTVYRDSAGGDSTTSQQFKFYPDETLKNVRAELGSYITDDYRFINYQNNKGAYSDMILSINFEDFAPLKKVVGLKNQVYLTNINKTVKTDLVGFNTDWFFDRYMSCQIALNTEDRAKPLNQGKMRPLMLTNVKTTNPNIRGFGAMDKVVICEKDSIIQFNLSSWGAAAYGYSIKPEAGTPITDAGDLFICFSGCTPSNYAGTALQQYYSSNSAIDKKMIQVVPTSSMNIGNDKVLQYMKFTVKTWIVTEYTTGDGRTIACNQPIPTPQAHEPLGRTANFMMLFETTGNQSGGTPYAQLTGANQQVVVPGNTITPGSTVPSEQQSSQVFGGPIHDLKMDNSPSGIIGEVTFYIFVFNSHADAMSVFSGINDIDPNVWKA